jgi:transposase
MQSTTIAVDLAKSVFEVAISQRPGSVSKRSRLSRAQFARLLATHEPATVVMEACGTAHHWARVAQGSNHRVLLLPPHTVRPYVPRNKTDGADAKGLLEALRNEAIRPVPVKSIDQHTLASLHRTRSERREGKPTTSMATQAAVIDWLPARDFHHGPERRRSTREAGDTTAVRAAPSASRADSA